MPSWNTPRVRMERVAVVVKTGLVAMMKGRPTRKVRHWPMRMPEKRCSPSSSPTAMNMPAMNMPAAMATRLPRI